MSIGNVYEDLYPAILAVGPEASRTSAAYALKALAEAGYEPLQINFPMQMSLRQIIDSSRENTSVIIVMGALAVGAQADCTDEVRSLLDVELPGVAELLRMAQMESGYGRALFERAVAGFAGESLVFTIPDDSRTALESMEEVLAHFRGWVLEAPAGDGEAPEAGAGGDSDEVFDQNHVATVLHMPLPKDRSTPPGSDG